MKKILTMKPDCLEAFYKRLYEAACRERDALRNRVLELEQKLGDDDPRILVTTAELEDV